MLQEDVRLLAVFTIIFLAHGLFIILRADAKSAALTNIVFLVFVGSFIGIKTSGVPPPGLSWFEAGTLGLMALGFLCSVIALGSKAPHKGLVWVGWTVNALVCAMLVYLAFFFKIF